MYLSFSNSHMNSKRTGRVVMLGLSEYSVWAGIWVERVLETEWDDGVSGFSREVNADSWFHNPRVHKSSVSANFSRNSATKPAFENFVFFLLRDIFFFF